MKTTCLDCKGSATCEHNLQKYYCVKCDGRYLCKVVQCEVIGNSKYKGYCSQCFCERFPDEAVARNHQVKERAVREFLNEHLPELGWVHDRRISSTGSRLKPDHRAAALTEILLIVETDEHRHSRGPNYAPDDEDRRLERLREDAGGLPLLCIRFNPDSYKDHDGKRIGGCFKENKDTRVLEVSRKNEWERRLERLKDEVKLAVASEIEHEGTRVVHLFYGEELSRAY